MTNKQLYITVPPIGISVRDNFTYDGTRPARHCSICGESFQPQLARSPDYPINKGVQYEVELLLRQWAFNHNKCHSEQEKKHFIDSGKLMTPEAALKLIPLGIYPIADLVLDDEVEQAGRESKRAPSDDIKDKYLT